MDCFYRNVLKVELGRRKSSNPNYSLRAFARDLDVSPSVISRALHAEREISASTARRLVVALKLSEAEAELFFNSVSEEAKKFVKKRNNLLGKAPDEPNPESWGLISNENFPAIASWKSYAILEGLGLSDRRSLGEICQSLGISEEEGRVILSRLVQEGLVVEKPEGGFEKKRKFTRMANIFESSESLRGHQAEFLEHSRRALETVPIENRVHMTAMLAIDPQKVDRARLMIDEFIKKLSDVITVHPQKEVYWLGCSLIPVSISPRENSDKIDSKLASN